MIQISRKESVSIEVTGHIIHHCGLSLSLSYITSLSGRYSQGLLFSHAKLEVLYKFILLQDQSRLSYHPGESYKTPANSFQWMHLITRHPIVCTQSGSYITIHGSSFTDKNHNSKVKIIPTYMTANLS